MKTETTVCPEGICDGSGFRTEGEFDNIKTVPCLCTLSKLRFFRRHKAAERPNSDDMVQKLTYKEMRTLIYASHRSPERAIRRILKGEKVATDFGTYWAASV